LGFVRALHSALAAINVCLGVLYCLSSGPYIQSEGKIVSTRSLSSTGSEDAFLVATALLSFLISALLPLVSRAQPKVLLLSYLANHVLYLGLLLLVQADTSLVDSVRLGDLPLFLGLALLAAALIAYAAVYKVKGRR